MTIEDRLLELGWEWITDFPPSFAKHKLHKKGMAGEKHIQYNYCPNEQKIYFQVNSRNRIVVSVPNPERVDEILGFIERMSCGYDRYMTRQEMKTFTDSVKQRSNPVQRAVWRYKLIDMLREDYELIITTGIDYAVVSARPTDKFNYLAPALTTIVAQIFSLEQLKEVVAASIFLNGGFKTVEV